MKEKLTNLTLRSAAIGIRFLFIFFIGKYLSLEFLGTYSLWNTTITLALLLVGFDFYIYSIRNILNTDEDNKLSLIKNHLVFILLSYIMSIPLLSILFFTGFLEMELIFLFYLVLLLEHFGMEMYRLFTALEKPVFANFLLLIRTASWMLVFSVLYFLNIYDQYGMEELLVLWAISAFVANLIALFVLKNQFKESHWGKTDWSYIKKGIRVSFQLFLATVALKVIEFSDRYMIDFFLSKKELGIFSFYYQLSNLVNVVIYTVVIMILYPKLYKAIFNKTTESNKIKKKMISQSVIIWIGLGIFVLLATPWILTLMSKPEMNSYYDILYLMLPASLFFNLYFIYKTCLNAYKNDSILLKISLIAAALNFLINILFLEKLGIYAASISSLISYFVMAMSTYYFERKGFHAHEQVQ